jgi:hypothetical protein
VKPLFTLSVFYLKSRMSREEKDHPLSTPHLNIHGLTIYSTKEKGRGVYGKLHPIASRFTVGRIDED